MGEILRASCFCTLPRKPDINARVCFITAHQRISTFCHCLSHALIACELWPQRRENNSEMCTIIMRHGIQVSRSNFTCKRTKELTLIYIYIYIITINVFQIPSRIRLVDRVSGEPIKIQNVYMIANGRSVFFSQPIRRPKTVPKRGAGRCLYTRDKQCANKWACYMYIYYMCDKLRDEGLVVLGHILHMSDKTRFMIAVDVSA